MSANRTAQEDALLSRCIQEANALGFEQVAVLDLATLQPSDQVQGMCRLEACASFNHNWGCPTGCGTLAHCRAVLERFTLGILVQTVCPSGAATEAETAQLIHTHNARFAALCDTVRLMEQEVLALTEGGCCRCENCAYPAPCPTPERMAFSACAFGLQIGAVCQANGQMDPAGQGHGASALLLFGKREPLNQILEQISLCAVEGKAGELIRWIHQALDAKIPPQRIAMAMTDHFISLETSRQPGDQDLTRLLQGARTTSRGMEVLRPYLKGNDGFYCYTAVVGTASGDLHDLGKNLVAMMLEVAGFRVVDLGIDISAEDFARAVSEDENIRLVGISCLLTTSLSEVKKIVTKLNKHPNRDRFKITVGGGATTREFALDCGADAYTHSAVDAAEYARGLLKQLYKGE